MCGITLPTICLDILFLFIITLVLLMLLIFHAKMEYVEVGQIAEMNSMLILSIICPFTHR